MMLVYHFKGIEYPELRGKTIKQVCFMEDSEFTALILNFQDDTRVRFELKPNVSLGVAPEIMNTANGNFINCKRLKTRSIPVHQS